MIFMTAHSIHDHDFLTLTMTELLWFDKGHGQNTIMFKNTMIKCVLNMSIVYYFDHDHCTMTIIVF